jgi:RNA polymerase primary sigma factor
VDGFDFARGNRFSTYATWVIRNLLADSRRKLNESRGRTLGCDGDLPSPSESDIHETKIELEEESSGRSALVARWLGRLDKRERWILSSRHGIGGIPELTLAQLGRQLHVSKERVRQIETRALGKLRKFAVREGVDGTEI